MFQMQDCDFIFSCYPCFVVCPMSYIFLLAQTEQMSRIVNELDSIHFSIKKATQLVKELGRQVNF